MLPYKLILFPDELPYLPDHGLSSLIMYLHSLIHTQHFALSCLEDIEMMAMVYMRAFVAMPPATRIGFASLITRTSCKDTVAALQSEAAIFLEKFVNRKRKEKATIVCDTHFKYL